MIEFALYLYFVATNKPVVEAPIGRFTTYEMCRLTAISESQKDYRVRGECRSEKSEPTREDGK